MSLHCRHPRSWIIAGGHYEWCAQCGALRGLKMIAATECQPRTGWVKINRKNPATEFPPMNKRTVAMLAKLKGERP